MDLPAAASRSEDPATETLSEPRDPAASPSASVAETAAWTGAAERPWPPESAPAASSQTPSPAPPWHAARESRQPATR